MSLNERSALAAAAAIRAGETTSAALVQACIERIASREPAVKAWSAFDADTALAEARQRDVMPSSGPLHGVPVAIKDVINTFNYPTQMGSPIYTGWQSRGDASCVAMLRAAGAVILGKTVTCELAGIAPRETMNPLDPSRTPGGSSSGSAAAVADRMVPVALGTQTGGSILRPAAFCGVVGMKPTYNAVNRQGLMFAAESLDTIGVITRDVSDAHLALGVLMNWKPAPLGERATPPRIGFCRTYLWDGKASPETRAALEAAAVAADAAGADVVEYDLPEGFERLTETRETINNVERARAMAWEWQHHRAALSPQMTRTIELGLALDADAYQAAQVFAERCRLQLDQEFARFDALLVPSTNGEAPVGLHYAGDPAFQGLWTLLHTPSITVPFAKGPGGMPVGVQFVGARRHDLDLMQTALWFEQNVATANG